LQLLFDETLLLESGVGFTCRFGFGAACSSENGLIHEIEQTNEQRSPVE
jgi:hypothetical protein